jgi:hypothetical protein
MRTTPVFDKNNPLRDLTYVTTNISGSEVFYSNELAFAECDYDHKEVKLLDIASSQISIYPLYNERLINVNEDGTSSIDHLNLKTSKIVEIYSDVDCRSVFISNKCLCEHLRVGGNVSRIPILKDFKAKYLFVNKKLFSGDKDNFGTERELIAEKNKRKGIQPFENIIEHGGYVEFIFNKRFVPYIIGIHGFKKYNLENSRFLKHKLSIRLLKLINYYHNEGGYRKSRHSRAFDLKEFMGFLGVIPKSYRTNPTLLFSKGVNPALKEISKVVGIHYKAETFAFPSGKKGRPSISSVRLVPLLMEETNLSHTQEGVS